mmetsp:Transcript_23167/g.45591  ORF Transcript_23167/g.45591 Transcript_23167/m.45591 type:complete len:156 (+) Transcript_23167:1352-1819(+)
MPSCLSGACWCVSRKEVTQKAIDTTVTHMKSENRLALSVQKRAGRNGQKRRATSKREKAFERTVTKKLGCLLNAHVRVLSARECVGRCVCCVCVSGCLSCRWARMHFNVCMNEGMKQSAGRQRMLQPAPSLPPSLAQFIMMPSMQTVNQQTFNNH